MHFVCSCDGVTKSGAFLLCHFGDTRAQTIPEPCMGPPMDGTGYPDSGHCNCSRTDGLFEQLTGTSGWWSGVRHCLRRMVI